MTEEINKGCEFQSDCIEYKDISYLKIMPICAIYELSIACHHKVNRCKYYKLYEQLKRLEQDSKQLTQWLDEARRNTDFWCDKCTSLEQENKNLKKQIESDKGLITVGGKQQYEYLQRIDELEQENKELKEYSQRMENQRENYYKEYNNYRSALEEIRENLVKLTTNDEDDFTYEYSKIEDKINEVLGNESK